MKELNCFCVIVRDITLFFHLHHIETMGRTSIVLFKSKTLKDGRHPIMLEHIIMHKLIVANHLSMVLIALLSLAWWVSCLQLFYNQEGVN